MPIRDLTSDMVTVAADALLTEQSGRENGNVVDMRSAHADCCSILTHKLLRCKLMVSYRALPPSCYPRFWMSPFLHFNWIVRLHSKV